MGFKTLTVGSAGPVLGVVPETTSDVVLPSNLAASGGSALVGFVQSGTGAVSRTTQSKLRDFVSVKDFGAVVDGVTNDNAAIQAAISAAYASSSNVIINGSIYSSTVPENLYGTKIKQGKLLVPSLVDGYKTQVNTYADDIGLMINRENLATWWKSITAGTVQNIYIYGDSTVQMDSGYPLKSHELFKRALFSCGVSGCSTVNRGVSGTSWSDLSCLTDLGTSTKLIVIKFGINDAVKPSALSTLAADARAKLTAIRAATYGGFSNLSILLMGPNSTYRPSQGQDARWHEELRDIYVQLCKEYDCAYFDTYAYLQQSRRAPGIWLDNISSSGEGVHPDAVAAYWIWYEGIQTHVLGNGQWNANKSTQFYNVKRGDWVRYPTDQPSTFPIGLSVWGVLASDGWPFNGMLTVIVHAEGWAEQRIRTLDTVPREALRSGSSTSNVWTQWTGEPIAISSFLNSWGNKNGGYATAGYVVGSDGFVTLYGVITGGYIGSAAFNLPASVRPVNAHHFCTAGAQTSGASANVTVFSDGNVIPYAASNDTIGIDGIRFKAL